MYAKEAEIVRKALKGMKRDLHRLEEKMAAFDELVRRFSHGDD